MPGSFEELNAKINSLKREGGVGYTEKGFAPMIAEMQVEIAANSTPSRVQVEGLGAYPWTTVGERVRVIWDGVPYECEVTAVNATSPWAYVGNFLKTQNKGDTGEPFCIMVSASYSFGQVYDFEDNSVTRAHTLAVERFTETIHPISDKYLPGVCLPVVEITSVKKTDGTTYALSETEAAAMEAAAETGLPICAKFNISDGEVGLNLSAVLSYMSVPALGTSAYAFAVDVETWSYYIAKEDGVWISTVKWSM